MGDNSTQNIVVTYSSVAATSLTVAAASGTFGGSANLSATLTSGASGVSGKTISFTLNGGAAGTATTNSSGVATVTGASLSGINANTYPGGVAASFAGDSSFSSSNGSNTLTVAKASQAIVFGSLGSKTFGDAAFTVGATGGGSGNPVTFSVGAADNCTSGGTNGATITITGAGSCTVTANQAGNVNYNAATAVPQTFSIAKASQAIVFGSLGSKTFGDAAFTVGATGGGSGNPVTFSVGAADNCTSGGTNGATITITGAGSCTVTANQAGNVNYNAATAVPQTFSIAKATPTVSISWVDWTFDGTAHVASGSVTGVGGADLGAADSISYYNGSTGSGSPLAGAPKDAGDYSAVAHVNATANYTAADSSVKPVTVSKATPTVSISWVDWTFDGTAHVASGSVTGVGGADLGAADSISYYNGSTGSGSPLAGAPKDAGDYSAVAHVNATANYTAADSSVKPVTVSKATPTVSISWVDWTFDGTAHVASGSVTGVGGADLGAADSISYYNGSTGSGSPLAGAPKDAGDYSAVAHVNATANYTAADSSVKPVTVSKATPTVSISWADWTFDGTAHVASGSVTGVGGADLGAADSISYYNGSTGSGSPLAGAPKDAGDYSAVAHANATANYTAADSSVKPVTVSKATPTVSISWADWTFDGTAHVASGSVTGVGGADLGAADSISYYNGSTGSGSPLAGAPKDAGDYSAVAHVNATANYTAADSSVKPVTVSKATPTVSISWADWTFDGTAHVASGSVTGVGGADLGAADSISYYNGSTGSGSPLAGAPKDAGDYSAVAHVNATANYTAADSSVKPVTVSKATPTVSISWADWTFDGTAHVASGSVTGVGGADLGAADSISYYNGSTGSGSPLAGAPKDAGDYSAVAHVNATANYTAADSSVKPVTVSKATPTVSISWVDWTFDGTAHVASGSVTGVGGADLGAADSISYYNGSTGSGSPLAGAPKDAGDYSAVAHANATANYTAADSSVKPVTVSKATPTVSISWADWTFDGTAHVASGSVTGVGGADLGAADSISYYNGSTGSGSPLAGAPKDAGDYSAVAHANATANYTAADSSVKPVTVSKATPTVSISWADWTFDGTAHVASGSVTGVGGADLGAADSISYYNGSTGSGSPLAGARRMLVITARWRMSTRRPTTPLRTQASSR